MYYSALVLWYGASALHSINVICSTNKTTNVCLGR